MVGAGVCFTCVEGQVNEHTAGMPAEKPPEKENLPLVLVSGWLRRVALGECRCVLVGAQGQRE